MLRVTTGLILILAATGTSSPAFAHPHVYITYRADVTFAPGGQVQAVRHHWTFDAGTSAIFLMGRTDEEGRPRPADLHRLARETAESLTPFDDYTEFLVDDVRQRFDEPVEPEMTNRDGLVTLSFTLPLHRPPVVHRTATLAVRDATMYNYFMVGQEAGALTLVNAPTACTARIGDAGDSEPEAPETFWEAVVWLLTQKLQDLGVMAKPGDPSDRFLIACPRPS